MVLKITRGNYREGCGIYDEDLRPVNGRLIKALAEGNYISEENLIAKRTQPNEVKQTLEVDLAVCSEN